MYLDVKLEKQHDSFVCGIEQFDQARLKRADTNEKVVLPDSEQLHTEKRQQELFSKIEKGGEKELRHVDPVEKVVLPDKATIELEKQAK